MEQRCDRCDMIIGLGCGCSRPSRPSPSRAGENAPDSGFPAGTILVSPRETAHQLGCGHQSDSKITAPVWGWIIDPDPHLWQRISESSPAHATHGNTKRRAVKRCKDCDT